MTRILCSGGTSASYGCGDTASKAGRAHGAHQPAEPPSQTKPNADPRRSPTLARSATAMPRPKTSSMPCAVGAPDLPPSPSTSERLCRRCANAFASSRRPGVFVVEADDHDRNVHPAAGRLSHRARIYGGLWSTPRGLGRETGAASGERVPRRGRGRLAPPTWRAFPHKAAATVVCSAHEHRHDAFAHFIGSRFRICTFVHPHPECPPRH